MYLRQMVFLISIILYTGCLNSTEINPMEEFRLSLSFQNNSNYKLDNLTVSDKTIGSLSSNSKSRYIEFDNFRFDTGMPDENASAMIDGKVYTNHNRGFWCGTEKISIDSGKYIIEIEVVDTVLWLSCKNAPTIFDP